MVYGIAQLHDHVCNSCGDRISTCRNNPVCAAQNNEGWESCKGCRQAEYEWSMRTSSSWLLLKQEDRRAIRDIASMNREINDVIDAGIALERMYAKSYRN